MNKQDESTLFLSHIVIRNLLEFFNGVYEVENKGTGQHGIAGFPKAVINFLTRGLREVRPPWDKTRFRD